MQLHVSKYLVFILRAGSCVSKCFESLKYLGMCFGNYSTICGKSPLGHLGFYEVLVSC